MSSGAHGRSITCSYIAEPLLEFGNGGAHVDPKSGIARYGPRSLGTDRHPAVLRIGLLGTAETIDKARAWIQRNALGVPGDAKHPEFPGFNSDRGFFSAPTFDQDCVEHLTQSEVGNLLAVRSQRVRFEQLIAVIEDRLRLLAERDHAPHYVLISLPDALVKRCRVVEYSDGVLGVVRRDLRRAIKAAAMKYRMPTQLLREQTSDGLEPDLPSKIAWNFFTGMYFKGGGIPWGPRGLESGTCYVGIGFYRPLGTKQATLQTSLVQAFDENGEGLVLRGHDFEWNSRVEGTNSPHLSEQQSNDLIQLVLDRYLAERKQTPRRVVVHKTSQYWPKEREGFKAALASRVARYDLVALSSDSSVRLLPEAIYPTLRGTRFAVGELDFLYTSGFISSLQEFHGMHVPSPLRITDHVGQDTSREQLLREILILTKMNWNSARLGGSPPVTLRFSQLVGEILREVPKDQMALPQFKFYV